MIRRRLVIALGLFALIVGQELASCPGSHAAAARRATADTQPTPAPQTPHTTALSHRVTRMEGRLDGMEAAPRPVSETSTFDWPTAGAAWVGAFIIAVVGSILTYLATVPRPTSEDGKE